MKRLFYSLWISLLFSLSALAQNEGISFQGLARNAAGEVLVSQTISLRLSILLGSESGAAVYSETRQTTTNPQGIFAVVLGDGTANSKTGNFSSIDWGTASKFIKVEMDPNAGTNFTAMGTSKLQPVPFAFYAYGVDAVNVQGILPVGSGGTGVASLETFKTNLGLDQVNNTSDANKPLSTAATTALATKVDKEIGKGLSSNDFSTAEKIKLAAITGDVAGPTGPQGPIGLTGPAGATGLTGAIGAVGPSGAPGPTGATGPQGPIGLTGATGLQGPIGLTGPAGNDGAVGPQGATGAQGPIGLTGPTGAIGPQGIQGFQGVAGIDGINGLDGKTILNGTTDPALSTGENGDFYINTSSKTIFGPKASGVWPTGVSLIGIASIGTISGTSTVKGASITAGELNLAPADGTNGGIVTTVAQTFVGAKTFSSDLTVNGMTIGKGAGSGSGNTAFGDRSLMINTANDNTAIGYRSLSNNTSGYENSANGNFSLANNISGSRNTANGTGSLQSNRDGSFNAAFGQSALYNNTTGSYNTTIGFNAGYTNTTGTVNTFIGTGADAGTNNLSNATAIGYGAIVAASNTIQLGNTSVTDVKTSGTITAGDVTYPNLHGTANQVLSTTGSGTLAWTTQAAGLPTSGNTRGDMLYWNGSAWVKIPVSANEGPALQLIGGVPRWVGGTPIPSVTSITGRIWMDRNLGATQVATSYADAASFGDYYQWGRGADGHQISTSSTSSVLSSTDVPGNANFILAPNSPIDWRSEQNDNLWQGLNGVNNPCPSGYRLPTAAEWEAERLRYSENNRAGAFASPLKLPAAGYRLYTTGGYLNIGSYGHYWTSTVSVSKSIYHFFKSDNSYTNIANFRAFGYSVRCIKD